MSRLKASELTSTMKSRYAQQAIAAYQNEMVNRYPDKWKYTLSSLINALSQGEPDFMNYLGMSVYTGEPELSQRRLREAMERVAEKSSPDKLPSIQCFNTGISDELSSWDWGLMSGAAIDIGKDLIKTGRNVSVAIDSAGAGISAIGANLKYIIPALGALVVFILYKVGMSKAK